MPKHAANTPSGTPADPAENSNVVPPRFDSDERIGLTEAFSPVESEGESTRNRDNAIGLTQAFSPVENSSKTPAHAGGFSYKGDTDDEYPDALESLEPTAAPSLLFDEDETMLVPDEPKGRHGKKEKQPLAPHQRKSRRMRRTLIVVMILLIILLGALGYFTFRLFDESQILASQQTQKQQADQEVEQINKEDTKDATTEVTKKTEAPNLAILLGKSQAEAVEAIKRGATETSVKEVNEEDNPIKKTVTLALTDEPADTRTSTPSVYLGLNEDGAIVQAGYSASTAALGFGSLSFADAVKNDHVVERTLKEAGINVVEGTVELPADKSLYTTYDSTGKKVVKESFSFSGAVDIEGASHEWSSVLSYDYAAANMSGNLDDTIRIIYVYINA